LLGSLLLASTALEKVLAVVDRIPDEAYHKDAGLFFKSLHATLNRTHT
jgi:uncharacterized damage-inducible protein DinB